MCFESMSLICFRHVHIAGQSWAALSHTHLLCSHTKPTVLAPPHLLGRHSCAPRAQRHLVASSGGPRHTRPAARRLWRPPSTRPTLKVPPRIACGVGCAHAAMSTTGASSTSLATALSRSLRSRALHRRTSSGSCAAASSAPPSSSRREHDDMPLAHQPSLHRVSRGTSSPPTRIRGTCLVHKRRDWDREWVW